MIPVGTTVDDSTSQAWPSSSATASRVAMATSLARCEWPAGPWLRPSNKRSPAARVTDASV